MNRINVRLTAEADYDLPVDGLTLSTPLEIEGQFRRGELIQVEDPRHEGHVTLIPARLVAIIGWWMGEGQESDK